MIKKTKQLYFLKTVNSKYKPSYNETKIMYVLVSLHHCMNDICMYVVGKCPETSIYVTECTLILAMLLIGLSVSK